MIIALIGWSWTAGNGFTGATMLGIGFALCMGLVSTNAISLHGLGNLANNHRLAALSASTAMTCHFRLQIRSADEAANNAARPSKLTSSGSSGLAAGRLEVEITESLFLESSDSVREILHGLKRLGVRIALDDFGTGFSSLSYLRKFSFDKIKIDRSFIIELLHAKEAGAVVKAITDLAAALNMETTAEGVEEPAQVDALRAHGCTTVQGYLFSRPVPADQVSDLLELAWTTRAA